MPLLRTSRAVFSAFLLCACALPLVAQIQPHARFENELLPIFTYNKESTWVYVLKDGKKRETWGSDYRIRSNPKFAEGFVTIKNIVTDLDPLRNASQKDRADPGAIRFRYQATLVPDRPLPNCYALLTYVTQGSVGTHLIPIGRINPEKGRELKFELASQVDSVSSLHVFSDGLELRSTQHPDAYELEAYFGGLVNNAGSLSAAELLKNEEMQSFVLSGDGQLLATFQKRDPKKLLVVYDLKAMTTLCEVPVAKADDIAIDLTWVSDHEVAYVAKEDSWEYNSEYKLHLLDARTGQTKELDKDIVHILSALPKSPETLLVMMWDSRIGASIYKFNVRTRKVSEREEPEYGNYWFDSDGYARVRMQNEGDEQIYFYRSTPKARWRKIDSEVKEPGLKFNLRSPDLLDQVAQLHSIGPDGDTLYLSTRLGTDRYELSAFSMSEGVIKKTIAKHPRYDLSPSSPGYSRLLFAKKSTQLLGIIYEAQKTQVVWLDKQYAAVQKSMDLTFPDHVNLPIDWSDDGTTFIYFSSNDQDPGTYYVFQPMESRLVPLLQLGERLKGKTLAKTTAFEFTARDGQKIPAYLTRPINAKKEPAPLLVQVHGGPMARDSWHFDAINQFFASRGYAVLQVNYRGSSGYGAAFQKAGLLARLDTVVLDDIADGVRYLIDQGDADPTRVVIMGASFGGWATYLSLAKYPELYHAGIAISAVANWRKTLRDDRWLFRNKSAYTFWKSLLNRNNFAADEKFIDPLLRAGEIKQPLFIVHGERDDIVHASEAKLMLDTIKKTNPNVQARSFLRSTHTYWPFADRVDLLNEMALFLDRHLGKSTPKNPE